MKRSLYSATLALSVFLLPLAALAEEGMTMPAGHPMAMSPAAQPSAPQTSAPKAMGEPCPMMQNMGGGRGSMMMGSSGSMRGGGSMGAMAMMMQHPDGEIAFLKTELKITPAQDAAWSAFADALRAHATQMNGHHDMMQQMMRDHMDMASAPLSLPESLSAQIQMMETQVASMTTYKDAVTKLYGVLSDEQKKSADTLLAPGH